VIVVIVVGGPATGPQLPTVEPRVIVVNTVPNVASFDLPNAVVRARQLPTKIGHRQGARLAPDPCPI